ncbi:MAG TPA: hypothetical protein VM734_33715 [Kofleriaceae bacterium]|nr:hypothetical protein [Kofleriaceae bacterium]
MSDARTNHWQGDHRLLPPGTSMSNWLTLAKDWYLRAPLGRAQLIERLAAELGRLGVGAADVLLDEIPDPDLRATIKTVLMSAAGGAVLGVSIGAAAAGPVGLKTGVLVGAAAGALIAAAALAIGHARQRTLDPRLN